MKKLNISLLAVTLLITFAVLLLLNSCTTSKVSSYHTRKGLNKEQRYMVKMQHKKQHCPILSSVSSVPR